MIYKICSELEWQEALASGSYVGSPIDRSDGFIHFSRRPQVAGTAAKYFVGRRDLLLVTVDEALFPAPLRAALRDEPSRGGELFPHLYAALPVAAATSVQPLTWDGARHLLPPGF